MAHTYSIAFSSNKLNDTATTPRSSVQELLNVDWVQRGPFLCLKVDGKFTGVDCGLPDMIHNGECAEYWRKQITDQVTALVLDTEVVLDAVLVFDSLDAALKQYGVKEKSSVAYSYPEDELPGSGESSITLPVASARTLADMKTVAALEWVHDGPNLNLVNGAAVLHRIAVNEAYPIGPETIELLEILRSTPYFNANVVVHLIAFLVEHDMELQEYLDEVYFAKKAADGNVSLAETQTSSI